MALVLKDRVQETTTTTGTGTITLAGAVSGFQSFSAIGDGNTCYYAIAGETEWEVGLGTYTSSGTTLSRDTILESSNGGTAVNFSAGTKNVFVTYPAEKSIYQNASGVVNLTSTDVTTALGYTPVTNARTLTINGTTFDLTANRTWSVGTVTSVAALTLGTTGTDVSSSVADGTTTPVITLNIPTASATNRGALSSTDWTTFNNKGTVTSVSWTGGIVSVATETTTPAFTIAGTSGGIPYFSSGTTWASSGALAANALVIGGGAGAAPATTTTGTGVVTAIGNAVNTTSGLVTQTATLTASNLLLGGGSGTGIASTTTGTGVVTALGIAANGSGGFVTDTGTVTLTNKTLTNPTVNNYVEGVVAIGTVSTSHTFSLTNGTVQTATLTASTACTFTMPTATAGKSFIVYLKQAAATGNGTATFTSVKWTTTPTVTATAGKMDIFSFFADGTNWYGVTVGQGYTP